MRVVPTAIADIKLIELTQHEDTRGVFLESYNRRALAELGINPQFVQDNQSLSRRTGTVRGLHFQSPPSAQAKLVRVIQGSIFDVAVDIRPNSPDFGRHVAVIMTSEKPSLLYIPIGFAHGFCTLEPDTLVGYKVSDYYAPGCDKSLLWSDPALTIAWPDLSDETLLSAKDRSAPLLADLPPYFIDA